MKKVFILVALIPALLLSGCFLFKKDAQRILQEEMDLDISAAEVNMLINTRKNNNNGLTYIQATFPDSSFIGQLQNKEGFHPLPFSQEITDFLYSTDVLVGQDGKLLLPHLENGYYYFTMQLENGNSEPFTLDQGADLITLLYDADTNKLYYCHLGIENLNVVSDVESLIKDLLQKLPQQ